MSHFSLNFQSSDKLWFTPTSMDPHPLSHHNNKHLPFLYHHSSLSLSDVDSDTTTNADTMSSSPPSIDQDYMFEKPLTPSDVGKLNRLVIPKQHAEKYFPLAASTALDGDKTGNPGGGGVLLGFEDESGKCWKFRYSYWNSSQSYVLTKGWSRYIKENKLVAGDVVLFQRHRFESNRFFIGWRRRDSATPAQSNNTKNPVRYDHNNENYGVVKSQGYYSAPHQHQISSFPSSYGPDCLHAAGSKVGQKGRQSGSGNSKRVRLFGVNLECQILGDDEIVNEEPQTSDNGSSLSTQAQTHTQPAGSGLGVGPPAYNYFDYVGCPPNTHLYSSHMDMNFPQDVNQMSNRLR